MDKNDSLTNGTKESLKPYVFFDVQIGESKGRSLLLVSLKI